MIRSFSTVAQNRSPFLGRLTLVLGVFVALGCGARPASAYRSEDPEVQQMIDRGIAYLEGLSEKQIQDTTWGGAPGHIIVMAYAHYKARHDAKNRVVRQGIRRSQDFAKVFSRSPFEPGKEGAYDKSLYEMAVAILLLCEIDAEAYKKDIKALGKAMISRQQNTGGFGYPSEQQGDTSQVQYVVLALWTMDQKGIAVPENVFREVFGWLMRVQDVDGSWPYRATDPGPNKGLIKQGNKYKSHSTALAGASSALIAADYFQFWRERKRELSNIPGLPQAVYLKGQIPLPDIRRKDRAPVSPKNVIDATERMDKWREETPYKRGGVGQWHYYSLYSIERYQSFLEFARDDVESEPEWYDRWVEQLLNDQDASGGWGIKDRDATPPSIATAFAILFLSRSTANAIGTISAGSAVGGWGLPDDTSEIKVDGGQIKGKDIAGSVTDLLSALEGDGADDLAGKSIPDNLQLATSGPEREDQLNRLERLARGSRSWQARRVAMRLLGQSDDMDRVPTLIYGLSDPDSKVKIYARDGLRFISRKFDGFDMPRKPSPAEIYATQKKWKAWYLTMRPEYIFLD